MFTNIRDLTRLIAYEDLPRADAIVAAVAHTEYQALTMEDFRRKLVKGGAFVDVKAACDSSALQRGGVRVWRLQTTAWCSGAPRGLHETCR